MAIISHLDVSIQADGKPLEEREDTSTGESDNSNITRYIPSKSGQLFAVLMLVPSEEHFKGDIICCDIYVDGTRVDTQLLQKGSPLLEEISSGLTLPDGTERPYQFSDIAIVEHDPATRAASDINQHKDVGKVVIKAYHKNRGEASNLYVDPRGWNEINVVDEKALKGQSVSHKVGLAPPVDVPGRSVYCKSTFLNSDNKPFAVFTFLYRSVEKLNEIFVPTPAASPEPEQTTEALNERIRELERQLKEAQPTTELIRGIKRERTENENTDGPVRQKRRPVVTTYLAMNDDDESFVVVEGPVNPGQPATQLDD